MPFHSFFFSRSDRCCHCKRWFDLHFGQSCCLSLFSNLLGAWIWVQVERFRPRLLPWEVVFGFRNENVAMLIILVWSVSWVFMIYRFLVLCRGVKRRILFGSWHNVAKKVLGLLHSGTKMNPPTTCLKFSRSMIWSKLDTKIKESMMNTDLCLGNFNVLTYLLFFVANQTTKEVCNFWTSLHLVNDLLQWAMLFCVVIMSTHLHLRVACKWS